MSADSTASVFGQRHLFIRSIMKNIHFHFLYKNGHLILESRHSDVIYEHIINIYRVDISVSPLPMV